MKRSVIREGAKGHLVERCHTLGISMRFNPRIALRFIRDGAEGHPAHSAATNHQITKYPSTMLRDVAHTKPVRC